MSNESKTWLAAAVIWTAIVASLASPARPLRTEMACLTLPKDAALLGELSRSD